MPPPYSDIGSDELLDLWYEALVKADYFAQRAERAQWAVQRQVKRSRPLELSEDRPDLPGNNHRAVRVDRREVRNAAEEGARARVRHYQDREMPSRLYAFWLLGFDVVYPSGDGGDGDDMQVE
jgi:hypothetical protein|eukprot:COSAG01_NODE_15292_length_1353_cov_4.924242_2_plen_123_part_00